MYACFDPKGEELICLATLQVSHAPSPPLLYIKHLSSALSLSLHTSSNTVIPIQFYQPQLITAPADPGHNIKDYQSSLCSQVQFVLMLFLFFPARHNSQEAIPTFEGPVGNA
jgi:hypothetical protein